MKTLGAQLFDKDTIDALIWPKSEIGGLARKVLLPFIKQGPSHYIENANTSLQALLIDDLVLPVAVNEPNSKNSYVCSLYSHYVNYGYEEINALKNWLPKWILKGMIHLVDRLLLFGEIDKAVFVNNWLLPTNLYPDISAEQIAAITKTLVKRYPAHAIAFRSVNRLYPSSLFVGLKQAGYDFLISRMIYFTKTDDSKAFTSRMFKSDMKVIKESPYAVVDDTERLIREASRLKQLYRALNIEKYSAWNPQFNENFIRLALEKEWMTLRGLELNGRIDAVLGYFTLNSVMTSPFFGYDTSLPLETGLYRQISTLLLLEAKERGLLLHQSSGAGHYKKLRRAEEDFEYTAVYIRHLPIKRRLIFHMLIEAMSTIGKSLLKHYIH